MKANNMTTQQLLSRLTAMQIGPRCILIDIVHNGRRYQCRSNNVLAFHQHDDQSSSNQHKALTELWNECVKRNNIS